MNIQDIHFLDQPITQKILRQHDQDSPVEFALRQKKTYGDKTPLLATQIKLFQKGKIKIPSFIKIHPILDSLALEQSSSEKTASLKFQDFQGDVALDLSCGLGVDAMELAKKYKKVITLEKDPVLFLMAKSNFQKLGLKQIEVIQEDCIKWIKNYSGPDFDLIYMDPSRRDAYGNRFFNLEDGKPNPFELMEDLHKHGKEILIKASPMISIEQTSIRLSGLKKVLVQSIQGECKEVLFHLNRKFRKEPLREVRFYMQGKYYAHSSSWEEECFFCSEDFSPKDAKYLYEADPAIYKGGVVSSYFQEKYSHLKGLLSDGPAYFLSSTLDTSFPSAIFEIDSIHPFKIKALKKLLRSKGIKNLQLGKKGFPESLSKIRQALKKKMGGTDFLLFFCLEEKRMVGLAKKIQ